MTKAEFLKELKAHDWNYSYACGDAYRKGIKNEERLCAIAETSPDLKALKIEYESFLWKGGPKPTVEAAVIISVYNRRAIMGEAWEIARIGSKRFGYPVKHFFSQALKQAWAKAKAERLSRYVSHTATTQVFTVCIDEVTGRNTKQINQLAVDAYFTDYGQARAAKLLIAGAFDSPFIKTAKAIAV